MKIVLLLCCILTSAVVYAQDTLQAQEVSLDHKTSRAEFQGGNYGLKKYIAENTVYPQEALENGYEGKVVLTFIVDRNGNPTQIQCLDTSVNQLLVNESIRVIETTSGKWTPAHNKGQKINMTYSVPFTFKLDKPAEEMSEGQGGRLKAVNERVETLEVQRIPDPHKSRTKSKVYKVYDFYEVTERAVFAEGSEGLYKHIALSLRYPPACLEKKLSGTVMLQFVITADGEVVDIVQVNNGIDSLLVAEAKRVLKLTSGNWIPAKKDGAAVNMRSVIPVKFELF